MNDRHLSFEFFPPKTPEGREKLRLVHSQLARFNPEFFSVTYGAGGSTRDYTRDIVLEIAQAGSNATPHLSFGGDSKQSVLSLLETYREAGIHRIVALRGDLPSGMGGAAQLIYANELVQFIREHFGDTFELLVAAYPEIHPEAENYQKDIYWLGQKFSAGASRGITQYFYNIDAYFYFRDQCLAAGIQNPIIPGIMPITNYQNLIRFSDNCGADVPRWIRQQLKSYGTDTTSIRAFGLDVVTRLCEKLLAGGAPGLHFYTMNQADTCTALCRNLGFPITDA
ncbi:methylenetetrahydrofolate reductase [NAD(P)H] [uncultured Porticoccus sp.]|uniref:methylenetetrahydrofolate reductase [NAD(P)H] n=1 Tax=uncultured Porticoccus sp. TaxID=1256050 RepID=UPI002618705D|nr:methylenetetrahydrofolate reductase [NAD(P)H] [uncultured Porticoccus sp.]